MIGERYLAYRQAAGACHDSKLYMDVKNSSTPVMRSSAALPDGVEWSFFQYRGGTELLLVVEGSHGPRSLRTLVPTVSRNVRD